MTDPSEIAFPPFGWVLTTGADSPDDRLAEITDFGGGPYHVSATVEVGLTRLPTHLAWNPRDDRSTDRLSAEERGREAPPGIAEREEP